MRNWTAMDIANLEVSFNSIRRNEVNADEEFPRGGVEETVETARAIASQAKAAQAPADDAGEGPADSQMGEARTESVEDNSPAAMKARDLTERA